MFDLSNTQETTEADKDFKGGGGFMWESGIHPVTVTMCYGVKKPSGAMCLHMEFANENGKKYKEDFYFLSGAGRTNYDVKDKKGNVVMNKDASGAETEPKTRYIPGYSRCANIVACAFAPDYDTHMKAKPENVSLNAQHEAFFQAALSSMEPKTVPVESWDNATTSMKTEDTDVDFVMTKLIGQSLQLGILKTLQSKNQKDDNGNYVPTAETRDVNEVSTEFSTTGFSAYEIRGQNKEATMYEAWSTNNAGKTIDKRAKQFKGTDAPAPGSSPSTTAGSQAANQPSLFG